MRAYLAVTGTVFGLIAAAHVWRLFAERGRFESDPFFHLLTVLAAALCGWAVVLLKRTGRR